MLITAQFKNQHTCLSPFNSVLFNGDMSTFNDRIEEAVKIAGGQTKLAEKLTARMSRDISQSTVRYLIHGQRDRSPPRSSELTPFIAEVTGLNTHWLATGEGEKYLASKKQEATEGPTEHHRVSDSAELHYHVRHAAPAPDSNEKLGLCLVDIPCESTYIPIFNATASMGSGRDLPEIEYQVGAMQLSHAWLRQHLNISHTNNLAVISADGDSMAPTFSSGDLLLIDRQVDQIKTDAIYALAMDDQLYVKRLARDIGDGSVNIISDNPAYGTQRITRERAEQLRVIGRVVFAWRGAKL